MVWFKKFWEESLLVFVFLLGVRFLVQPDTPLGLVVLTSFVLAGLTLTLRRLFRK